MFYTKYRPQKFEEVSKPNDVATALMTQLASSKIGHAYLFIGPRGTGKTTTARILAKALNCKHKTKEGDCCDDCKSCKEISEGKYLDLIEIDAASNRGIDDIRSLKEKVNLSPALGKYKVYIIDEVHMLTLEAFNALLKTLEEPPKHAIFILCTTESHKVPETIKSRCQVFKFKRPSVSQLVERLEDLAKKEKFKISKADLEKIAAAASGGFRDADTLLQQVVEGGLDIKSLAGSNPVQSFVDLTGFIISGKTQGALSLVNKQFEEGVDLYSWGSEYIRYLRDLLYVQVGFSRDAFGVTEEVYAKMEEQSFKLSSSEIVKMLEVFMKAVNEIKGSVISSLPLEIAIVSVSERASEPTSYSSDTEALEDEKIEKNDSDLISISIDSLNDKWGEILKDVKPFNHSVEALLRSCKPKSLEKDMLILEVSYSFHKERLESPKSKEIIEKVLANKFGNRIRVKCVLRSKEGESLTDKNIETPKDPEVAKTALEVFDGELVL